jgi:hypothetical protein
MVLVVGLMVENPNAIKDPREIATEPGLGV